MCLFSARTLRHDWPFGQSDKHMQLHKLVIHKSYLQKVIKLVCTCVRVYVRTCLCLCYRAGIGRKTRSHAFLIFILPIENLHVFL